MENTHPEHGHKEEARKTEEHHEHHAGGHKEQPKKEVGETADWTRTLSDNSRMFITILITAAVTAVIVGAAFSYIFSGAPSSQHQPRGNSIASFWGMQAPGNQLNMMQNGYPQPSINGQQVPSAYIPAGWRSQQYPVTAQNPSFAETTKTYNLTLNGGKTVEFDYPADWSVNADNGKLTFSSADGKSIYTVDRQALESGNGVSFNSQSSSTEQAFSLSVTTAGNDTMVKISDNPAETGIIRTDMGRQMEQMMQDQDRINREMDDLFWKMGMY